MSVPVVVIGMHRSGTGLLTTILERMGVFMGAWQERNGEAVFHWQLNEWLLRQSGASWDHPEPVRAFLADERARELAVDHLAFLHRTPWVAGYLGAGRYLRYRKPQRMASWGFKDPRTTFTLPVWTELYGGAKVVHIVRHGVDVAQSMRLRSDRWLDEASSGRRWLRSAVFPLRAKLRNTYRCTSLDEGLDLWDAYVSEAERHVAALAPDAVSFRYEDLLDDPLPVLRRLRDLCEVDVADGALSGVVADMDRGRKLAFVSDPSLVALAEKHADRLRVHGY